MTNIWPFMKTFLRSLALFATITSGWATTIDAANKYAYGANIGWIDWRGDTTNGAVIGEYVCSGYIYSANCGWIHLGSNAPANGIQYQNNSATDYGVNHDGSGNLSGLAYGANIGWIVFTNSTATGPLASTDLPRVDLNTGKLRGYIYSANCGWISLSNSFAVVQTDTIQPGTDSDGDGIADAWELQRTNTLTAFTATSDKDGDGSSDLNEYLADTNPFDPNSAFKILAPFVSFGGGNQNDDFITWTSQPTRFYMLEYRTNLTSDPWHSLNALYPPDGATTTRDIGFGASASQRYFRVRVIRPLAP